MRKLAYFCAFVCAASTTISTAYAADAVETATVASDNTVQDPSSKVKFPKQLKATHDGQNYTLDLTGTATRSKFFVNVYAVGHYIQDPAKGKKDIVFDDMLNENKPKALLLEWVHDASQQKVKDGLIESFRKTLSDKEYTDLGPKIDQFVGYYAVNIKPGDKQILRWFPDGTVEVEYNGQVKGSIKDPALAKAVWNIWLGPKSVVSRGKLVNQLTTGK